MNRGPSRAGRKAPINRTHSRRFARFGDARRSRSVWSACGLSAAFPRQAAIRWPGRFMESAYVFLEETRKAQLRTFVDYHQLTTSPIGTKSWRSFLGGHVFQHQRMSLSERMWRVPLPVRSPTRALNPGSSLHVDATTWRATVFKSCAR